MNELLKVAVDLKGLGAELPSGTPSDYAMKALTTTAGQATLVSATWLISKFGLLQKKLMDDTIGVSIVASLRDDPSRDERQGASSP